jgi:hypothetical protein
MNMFDLINAILMAYLLGLLGAPNDGSGIELVFVGDAIPGTINGH